MGLVTDDDSIARHAAIRCGSFAAHTYPVAPDRVAKLGADLITWLFLFDDRYGESVSEGEGVMRRHFRTYDRALRTGVAPSSATPFHHALINLRSRALDLATAAWLERFADSMRTYFDGCLAEKSHRSGNADFDLAAYRSIRRYSVGAFPVFDLIELSSGLLPDHAARSTEIARARELAALLCAWVNDIFSFPKERQHRDPLNLVSVIARTHAVELSEALHTAANLFREDLSSFEEARTLASQTLAPTDENGAPSTAIAAYLDGLAQWVHGNTAWTGLCGRYAVSPVAVAK